MTKKILILGASGNFGSKIAKKLASTSIPLILAGRQEEILLRLQNEIKNTYPNSAIEIVAFDVNKELDKQLTTHKPFVVINTCGPFQTADYSIPLSCAHLGVHYVDIADGRNFVTDITTLNDIAQKNNACIVSGASTVPGLSSAVISHFKNEFSKITAIQYGISPGQKTERGLAVTQGVLGYTGKPLNGFKGQTKTRYGWQDIYLQTFPVIGKRWMANCDIPDLDLFPKYFNVENIKFGAGTENSILHLSIWIMSWLVRLGIPLHLERHAKTLLKVSHFFDRFGTEDGGMHMIISGLDHKGKKKTLKWFIIATHNKGPYIPTIPAIVLAKKFISGELLEPGAYPCINLVTLEEFLAELGSENIQVFESLSD